MSVTVHNYIPEIINKDENAFTSCLDSLSEELSANEPFRWMIRGSIKNAVKSFAEQPDRDRSFQMLIDADLTRPARETV